MGKAFKWSSKKPLYERVEDAIMAKIRIDKYISNMGYGSRTEIKNWIKNSKVLINNSIIKDSSYKVNTELDIVSLDGNIIKYEKYTYLMMNKPADVVSSTDSKDTNVIDILDGRYRYINLFPAGRLDKDTEGLILLTNDGKMAHNILSPKKHVDKKYYVEIDGYLTEENKYLIENGVILEDGYKCLPCEINIIENFEKLCKLNIVIREGKYHQIKRMFMAVSKTVMYLKRISMAGIDLDKDLKTGEYRELTMEELKFLPVSKD
jgi:16S rRNA pseudouridine516 synthase